MFSEAIREKIDRIIMDEFGVDEVTPETRFIDLDCDSLDMVEVVMRLEESFDIEIADEDVTFETVADAHRYVETRLKEDA